MIAPKIQEMTAAGPAILAASPAPNSHPDPINEFRASKMTDVKDIFWLGIFDDIKILH